MKMLVQRVKYAKVSVEGKTTGEIEQGFLVLLGIAAGGHPGDHGKNGGQAAAAADLLG